MINGLSFDFEYWWCNDFLKKYLPQDREDCIQESLDPVIQLLKKHDTRATFFILGSVVEKYPQSVETIYKNGHEIACHGYSHTAVDKLGKEGFSQEIKKSVDILESFKPIGFRAPSFSVNNSTKWFLEILEKNDFLYDSSIFPVNMIYYGVPKVPGWIYRPSKDDICKNDPSGTITEFPISPLKMGMNVPVAGGFYFRFFPFWFLHWSYKQINRTNPTVIYLHPWETFPGLPRLKVPLISRIEAYYGVNDALNKMELLLESFRFQPIKKFLEPI